MTDVKDAPHLRFGLGAVEEIRVFPRDDVTGGRVEAAFAHNSPLRAGYAGVLQKRCVAIMWGAKAVASAPPRLFETSPGSVQTVERPLEPAGMRFLGLGEGLEPVGDLVEAFLAGGARHARIHIGVFVGLAGDGGAQIIAGAADRLAGRRVADLFDIFEMTVRMAGLAFARRA